MAQQGVCVGCQRDMTLRARRLCCRCYKDRDVRAQADPCPRGRPTTRRLRDCCPEAVATCFGFFKGLVEHYARRLWHGYQLLRYSAGSMEDLCSLGYVALLELIHKHDPDNDSPLRDFITKRLKLTILHVAGYSFNQRHWYRPDLYALGRSYHGRAGSERTNGEDT